MKQLTLLLLTITSMCFGQKTTLTIDSCIQMAKRNYPLIKQNKLIEEIGKNYIQANNKNWLPKLSFNSKATYQSEVIQFSGISFPHDNYISSLDVDQTLFDAGQLKQQKQLDRLNNEQELLKNEVEMYKLIDRVSQLYYSILLMRENFKTLTIYKNDITNKKINLSESLKNGLILQSTFDELEAEELKTEQSIIETQNNIQAINQSLEMFINMPINDSTELSAQPIINTAKGDEINRPEIKLFDAQKALLDARYKLTTRNTLPHLALNGQGAYGRPGPNFLNQNLRFFAQGGISLKWNIGSLYNLSNEKQNRNISKQMIDVQKEVFDFNLKTFMIKQTGEINSLKAIIEKDEKIIEKRHNISLTASKQLDNGNITSTDYLTQLNAEMQAILNKKVHEIKLMNAITSYNFNRGINNF